MRTVFAVAMTIMAVMATPALAKRGLCDWLGNNCQAIYQQCLVGAKRMGGTDANCKYQLAKSKTTGYWHGKSANIDCPCQ